MIRSYRRIAEAAQEQGGDFHLASRYLVEAMFQSPRYIDRIERQAGDGSTRELDGYELASRLSYILGGRPRTKRRWISPKPTNSATKKCLRIPAPLQEEGYLVDHDFHRIR